MDSDKDEVMRVGREQLTFHIAALASRATGEPLDELLELIHDPVEIGKRVGAWLSETVFGDEYRKKVHKAVSDEMLDDWREKALKQLSEIQAERDRRERAKS